MRFFRAWAASMRKAYPQLRIPSPSSYTPPPGSAYDQILARGRVGGHKRTQESMALQLAAFGLPAYEVQCLAPKELRAADPEKYRNMRIEVLTADEVMERQPYLAARNAAGYGVYIRPAPIERDGQDYGQPILLMDDLSREQVSRLKAEGLPANIVVETSPENFQAWIRVGHEPVPAKELTRAAQILAKAVGADTGAADWRHHGRLAGFVNTKPRHRQSNGYGPFSKIWADKRHRIAPNGPALLAAAKQQIGAEEARRTADADMQARISAERRARAQAEGRIVRDVVDLVAHTRDKYHGPDASAADFSAILPALRMGYDPEEVADALRVVSPGLAERHPDVDAYLERTIRNAQAAIAKSTGLGPRR